MSSRPFVPGQKNNSCPGVPCPGTRAEAKITGQTPQSRDVPGQNELKIFKKGTQFPVLEHAFLF
jgi:hypothetical protein